MWPPPFRSFSGTSNDLAAPISRLQRTFGGGAENVGAGKEWTGTAWKTTVADMEKRFTAPAAMFAVLTDDRTKEREKRIVARKDRKGSVVSQGLGRV